MARDIALCLLLMMSSLQHVTSFTVHRRHSRNSGLTNALRMLERQRRRIDNEESLAASSNRVVNEDYAQLDPFRKHSAQSQSEINPVWLAKTLGPDSSRLIEQSPEDLQIGHFWEEPVQPSSSEIGSDLLQPTFDETEDDEELPPPPPSRIDKKDKEVMTNVVGDARPKIHTRSSHDDNVVIDSDASDDVSERQKKFSALVQAVERIQEEALEKAEEEEEEEEEVMEEVQEKIAQAREKAKEEVAKEEEEEEEDEEEAAVLATNPLTASGDEDDDDLNDLFEEQSEEVIPTDNGEIIKVDRTLKNSAGEPVGEEEMVEQLQTFPEEDSSLLPPAAADDDDLWYLKSYIDEERRRRKRMSKRNSFSPTSVTGELPALNQLTIQLIQAYVKRIRDLGTDLDQVQVQTYLEDVENDLLTQALDQATLAQLQPDRLPTRELVALRDAIRVEEMLQDVKADRMLASNLAEKLRDEASGSLGINELKKRGEPWRKRSDATHPEIPVFAIGGGDDVTDDVGSEPGDRNTALAIKTLADEDNDDDEDDDEDNAEDPFVPFSEEDIDWGVNRADDDLIGKAFVGEPSRIASLFSADADQCPAVQAFSTNCQFAGHSIDYEARALCNLHEMCYVCGRTLEMQQSQCDFIYQAASALLCEDDARCTLDSQVFLNAMKLKHRFVPYLQPLCRLPCTARFLSIV